METIDNSFWNKLTPPDGQICSNPFLFDKILLAIHNNMKPEFRILTVLKKFILFHLRYFKKLEFYGNHEKGNGTLL